ncbi:MAG TPA: formylglycine-generating enzyme family protein [Sphingobacteriaceae bacterium]
MTSLKNSLLIIALALITGPVACANDPKSSPTADMVKIAGGSYEAFFETTGDKTVRVKPFYLDTKAVTNAEYLEFVKANPKWSRSKVTRLYTDAGYLKHWKGDFEIGNPQIRNSPVTNVSWFAANAYSKWKGKRLPTMAEWEYAGRASFANDSRPVEEVILDWYSKPSQKTLPPVGSSLKNVLNVYDMHGLIWEWVSDFNGIVMGGDSRSNSAIQRDLFCASGSFSAADKEDYAAFMRFAFRGSLEARYSVNNLGFRCAMDAN